MSRFPKARIRRGSTLREGVEGLIVQCGLSMQDNENNELRKIGMRPLYLHFRDTLWTRGDGYRYKDWPVITSIVHLPSWSDDTESIRKQNRKSLQYFIDVLKNSGAKEIMVAGPHGSDYPMPAYILGKFVFVDQGWGIEFATKSRFRNRAIWRVFAPKGFEYARR